MTIETPKISHVPALRALFTEAFHDDDGFIDGFFSIAYSPERTRILIENDEIKAALYWFDCRLSDERIAYIFGVSTAKPERGRGLCTALMTDTHEHLRSLGYSGAILVPAEDSLYDFYERLGYRCISGIDEIEVTASKKPADIDEISPEEYYAIREELLPKGGISESIELIRLLASDTKLYTGTDFLLAARKIGGRLVAIELLGNREMAPDITAALGCDRGSFRAIGNARRFSMIKSFKEDLAEPTYFGIALDI